MRPAVPKPTAGLGSMSFAPVTWSMALPSRAGTTPWQLLAAQTGARLRVVPLHDDGTVDLPAYH